MELLLLGSVAVTANGGTVDVGPGRQRCVLAALAVDVGQVVSTHRLIERVWGDEPPARARATLLSYLSRLRQILKIGDASVVVRKPGGYALVLARSTVDLHRFRDLSGHARSCAGDDERAVRLLRQALELWRGEALTGIDGAWASAERDRIQQERLAAERDLVDAMLRLGHGETLVADLTARAAESPLDERIAGQLVLALHRAGRVADALAHYRHFRQCLVDELGTEPGAALRNLHRQVLAAEPVAAGTGNTAGPVIPRQLPAPPAPFVGRRGELDRLDAAFAHTSQAARGAAVFAIAGGGGMGKTWLALHWAHRHLERFPDGQLFVDLRGFSPDRAPVDPSVALRGFLDALGVEPGRIPLATDAQVALFRSLVADKRILLILDNAVDSAQVVPLLPGNPTCTVVVTSRHHLHGLIVGHAARHLPLDVLSDGEADDLLRARLGADRVANETADVRDLIGLCGGFPLALSIVASYANTRRDASLADLATELRGAGLGALDAEDPTASLPATLSWSRRRLTDRQLRVFALLGIAPGPDIGLPASVHLTGLLADEARAALGALERASLLTRDARGRYAMHDLIRRYAIDTALNLPAEVREAALRQVVEFYLSGAYAADRLLSPHRPPITLDPGTSVPPQLVDTASALEWFENEHTCLLAAQQLACTYLWHRQVWGLAWSLDTFHYRHAHRHADLASWQTAVAAVGHESDSETHPVVDTVIHRLAGTAYADVGRYEEAVHHLREAVVLAERRRDLTNLARAQEALAWVWNKRGDLRRALEHATHSLRLHESLGNPVWQADASNTAGWYCAQLGDYGKAREHCEAALALYRVHHDVDGEASTHDSLGYVEYHTDHPAKAVAYYRQALALRRELGDVSKEADTLDRLGHPYIALGRHDQARATWERALELYRVQQRTDDVTRLTSQLGALGAELSPKGPQDSSVSRHM